MVRRVGPGVPLRGARAPRPGVRQGPAAAAAARVVHAPQRPAAGVRVGVRRRQPAGARLGGAAGLRDRRRPRPRLPGPDLPQAAAQLHLVGQPQGQRRATTSSRAASSAWTTSGRSTGPRRCRSPARSSRPTAPPGWRCTASTCSRSRSILAEHDPSYEDLATKFFEHFAYIADAMRTTQGLWDEDDGFFYDVLAAADGTAVPLRVRSMVGLLPLLRDHDARRADPRSGCRTSPTRLALVRRAPSRSTREVVGLRARRDGARRPAAVDRRRRPAARAS